MQQASVTEYHTQNILEMNTNVLVCVLISSESLCSFFYFTLSSSFLNSTNKGPFDRNTQVLLCFIAPLNFDWTENLARSCSICSV